MVKPLLIASIAGFMILGVPTLSHAEGDDKGHGHSGDGDGDDRGGHHSAPEPLTAIGLALGAGGVAVARWAVKRKSRSS
jgi:hypothetical protein